MNDLGNYLSHGSLGLILLGLALTQLGLPLPETPFIVAAGVVSERSGFPLGLPMVSCSMAVLTGDLVLYYLASTLGQVAFQHRPLRWLLPPEAKPRIDALFEKHGSMTIFLARFISGVRAVVFILAGMRRVSIWRFLLWDGLAIAVTVPIFAVLGYTFANCIAALDVHVQKANRILLVACVLAVIGYLLGVGLRRRYRRQI